MENENVKKIILNAVETTNLHMISFERMSRLWKFSSQKYSTS
jgi:hypothetical protein